MEAFVEFLRENWRFLVELLCLVLSIILLLLKKKNKVVISSSVISDVLVNLPAYIEHAEEKYGSGHGNEKLKFVMSEAIKFLEIETGLSTADILRSYGETLILNIENILSTPQKKGDQ